MRTTRTRRAWSALLLGLVPLAAFGAVPVGNEFQVNETSAFAQEAPGVAFDAVHGEYVVVWESVGQDGDGRGVYGRRYDSSGNPIGGEFLINSHTASDQAGPSIAALPGGGFVVVWESLNQDGDFFGIFARRFGAGATPVGAEFQVNAYTFDAQEQPDVCSDADGDVLIAWESRLQDGDSSGIFARRYDAALNPVGTEFQVNTYTAYLQGAPRLACPPTAGGERLVLWESIGQEGGAGGNRGIYAQRLQADGSPAGSEFLVNTYLNHLQSVPSAGIDANGGFVIAWGSNTQDSDSMSVIARRYASGGIPIGEEFQVNTFTFDRQRNPRVAVRSSGEFVIVWESYNQERRRGRWGSFGQQFDSTGNRVGREFLVNTYVRAAQGDPDLAVNETTGEFLVAWNSELQDGDGFGVFAQRMSPVQLCGPTPQTGCVPSGRASFRARNRACDPLLTSCLEPQYRDLILWRWARGAAPPPLTPLGSDNTAGTSDDEALSLCVYDFVAGVPQLVAESVVPPGGTCGKNPCWTPPAGASLGKYRDRDVNPHGVKRLVLGQRSVTLVGKGMLTQPPRLPMSFDSSVVVQLVGQNGGCIETVFDAGSTSVDSNSADFFDVKN